MTNEELATVRLALRGHINKLDQLAANHTIGAKDRDTLRECLDLLDVLDQNTATQSNFDLGKPGAAKEEANHAK